MSCILGHTALTVITVQVGTYTCLSWGRQTHSSMPIVHKAVVVILFVQAILCGLYIATLTHCLRWLMFADEGWRLRKRINWPMLIVTIVVSILSSIGLGLSVTLGFRVLRGGSVGPPKEVLVRDTSVLIIILILNAVLIYRCWEVYARSWRVVLLPAIPWFVSAGLSIMTLYADHPRVQTSTRTIALSGFSICNIVTNVYITCAITYRILSVARASAHQKRLRNTARVVAESGILYTSATIIFVIGILLGDKTSVTYLFHHITSNISYAAACIAFHLIVIRISQNRVESADSRADSETMHAQQIVPARPRCFSQHSAAKSISANVTDTP